MNKNKFWLTKLAMCLLLGFFMLLPANVVKAAEPTEVQIHDINYENLTLSLKKNGNTILYYSTNQTTWNQIEGIEAGELLVMDISWVSATSDTTLYFKGDKVTTAAKITLPKKNSTVKAVFNKADGSVSFSNCDEATYFQWRKATDYNWTTVPLDEASKLYETFLTDMEALRIKGAKIIVRTAGKSGDGSDAGLRPSKEITLTVTARSNAPTVKVNITKLTLSTLATMEYRNMADGKWIDCEKTMTVEDIAPKALIKNGGTAVTLEIRTLETESKPYSKSQTLVIPAQRKAPTIGDDSANVSYYYKDNKTTVLTFKDASATNAYEYAIVRPDKEYDELKLSWRSVTASKAINISKTSAPSGSVIYIRLKGTAESATKKVELKLPSEKASFQVVFK